jgi:Putative peptidoglycan binding domain
MADPTEELHAAPTPTAESESLSAFEATRRPIVLSYCTWVCQDDRAVEAVDDAFARLERELDAAEGREPIRIDRVLREAARDAAAERVPAADERTSLVRRIGGRDAACDLMPTLLAARASGRLSEADDDRIARHVRRCASCRELERRHVAAERAYEAFLRNGVSDADGPPTEVDGTPRRFERVRDVAKPVAAPREPAPRPDTTAVVAAAPPPPATPPPPPPAAPQAPLERAERPGRSAWLRRAGLATLIAAVVAAVVIAIAALAGGSESDDNRAAAPRPAEPAPAPSPAPEREAPPQPARDRPAERLDALGDRMLGPGAVGPDVRALQRLLGVPRTGAYDDATVQAVIAFQTANGLNPDGNAGPETKRLIAEQPPAGAE